jgi:hypothetical protein
LVSIKQICLHLEGPLCLEAFRILEFESRLDTYILDT